MDLLKYYALWFGVMNLLDFVLMGIDKQLARRHKWRIAEKTLLCVAALGGSLGSFLGMYLFHHKTKHPQFYITLPILLVLHTALTGVLLYLGILK